MALFNLNQTAPTTNVDAAKIRRGVDSPTKEMAAPLHCDQNYHPQNCSPIGLTSVTICPQTISASTRPVFVDSSLSGIGCVCFILCLAMG